MVMVGLAEILFLPLFYALALRASTWILNSLFSKPVAAVAVAQQVDGGGVDAAVNESSYSVSEAGPYTSPATYAETEIDVTSAQGKFVPVPGFLKTVGISFLTVLSITVVMIVVGIVSRLALSGGAAANTAYLAWAAVMLSFPVIVMPTASLILRWLLPTSFGRALAVVSLIVVLFMLVGMLLALFVS